MYLSETRKHSMSSVFDLVGKSATDKHPQNIVCDFKREYMVLNKTNMCHKLPAKLNKHKTCFV